MQIQTSYYGNIKKLPEDFFIVAISGGIPDALKDAVDYWDQDLAPSLSIFNEYKKIPDSENYVSRFQKEIMPNIDWLEKLETYERMANDLNKMVDNIVFLCYEKVDSGDGKGVFCHRHVVAEIIEREFKTVVTEYGYEDCKRENYRLVQPISVDFLF